MTEYCTRCSTMIEEWDESYYFARDMLCINCYQEKLADDAKIKCQRCFMKFKPNRLKIFRELRYCEPCHDFMVKDAAEHECAVCKRRIGDWEEKIITPSGSPLCKRCHDAGPKTGSKQCARCGKEAKAPFFAPDGRTYCADCVPYLSRNRKITPNIGSIINRIFSPEAAKRKKAEHGGDELHKKIDSAKDVKKEDGKKAQAPESHANEEKKKPKFAKPGEWD